jgi:4-hydroxybenzoate polyprenyltransferase
MRLGEFWAIQQALFALIAFCLISSALYIVNDIKDAPADRAHPTKRRRPIAAGHLSTSLAATAAACLAAAGIALACYVGPSFALVAAAYIMLTLAYCFTLKHLAIIDVMTIAAGFVLRLVGGAAAVQVHASHWLIICAFLLALFLALVKRRQELLVQSQSRASHRRVLEEYSIAFVDQATNVVVGAAIVCYALYTVAPETVVKFNSHALVYGTVFVLYGFLRYLSLIQDPAKGEDPTKMLVKDLPLICCTMAWAAYNAAVIYRAALPVP